ncbi:Nucleoside/nucleotide_kinase [Hexamita inflata]|uniref:Nucleoside/nucleotide kinase n=1 Tax=Hexamita inflata TaxID=28002 RepID=A0AA86RHI7_9EUKA|nr:Nucleoside/nucleotide kinase [Hexamita inflata]CAI9916202.1 Nucleoside/nucleotide kinase [Hexamita inflata]CAI9939746.1 Nucleoside/nucleotide kinase [Hexamita inflata]CAI9972184.1 Nucleoside/nucleotide kinase [Hexamita inflata]
MKIICLEGCHGVGKTTLINDLQLAGEIVLDEMFVDMPSFSIIAPQSLTMETIWIAKWFNRLLQLYNTHKGKILYADRSPYSAIYYSKSTPEEQQILKQLIETQILEMNKVGIQITTVCLDVQPELLWKRILTRLEFEPMRKQYNEDSRAWMDKTNNWYQTFTWDFILDNSEAVVPPRKILEKVLQTICK